MVNVVDVKDILEGVDIDIEDATDIYPKEGESLEHFIERKKQKGKLQCARGANRFKMKPLPNNVKKQGKCFEHQGEQSTSTGSLHSINRGQQIHGQNQNLEDGWSNLLKKANHRKNQVAVARLGFL